MRNDFRALKAVMAAASLFVLGGCDVTDPLENVDLKLDIKDAPVVLRGESGAVAVQAGTGAAQSTHVSMSSDVDEVSSIQKVSFKPANFTFSGASGYGAGSSANASGTIRFLIAVAGIPIPGMPVTVTVSNNVVTSISPSEIDLASPSYDKGAVEALYGKITAGPALPSNWSSLTAQQAVKAITDAITTKNFSVHLLVYSDDLTGRLKVGEFSIDGQASTSLK